MMVMVMMEEVANQSSFFMHKFFHQLIFTNPLIWTTRLKLVKIKNKQGHLEASKFKNKKNEIIMIYFWPLTSKKFHRE